MRERTRKKTVIKTGIDTGIKTDIAIRNQTENIREKKKSIVIETNVKRTEIGREIKTGTENTVKDQGIPRVAVCGAMLYAELEVESLVAHVLLFCRITIYLSRSFPFQIVLG